MNFTEGSHSTTDSTWAAHRRSAIAYDSVQKLMACWKPTSQNGRDDSDMGRTQLGVLFGPPKPLVVLADQHKRWSLRSWFLRLDDPFASTSPASLPNSPATLLPNESPSLQTPWNPRCPSCQLAVDLS